MFYSKHLRKCDCFWCHQYCVEVPCVETNVPGNVDKLSDTILMSLNGIPEGFGLEQKSPEAKEFSMGSRMTHSTPGHTRRGAGSSKCHTALILVTTTL